MGWYILALAGLSSAIQAICLKSLCSTSTTSAMRWPATRSISLVGAECCSPSTTTCSDSAGRGTSRALMLCSKPHSTLQSACSTQGISTSSTQLRPCPLSRYSSRNSSISQCTICRLSCVNVVGSSPVSYTHLRAHETDSYLVCRLLLEKKKKRLTYSKRW